MRINFKVSFYLRSNYENKEGNSPVMLRVFLNGEMANFGSSKIFVGKLSPARQVIPPYVFGVLDGKFAACFFGGIKLFAQ